MAFLEPQIEFGQWVVADGDGTTYIPLDVLDARQIELVRKSLDAEDDDADTISAAFDAIKDYVEFDKKWLVSLTIRDGWGYRLSAPGFMDCTEWTVFDTEAEAKAEAESEAEQSAE